MSVSTLCTLCRDTSLCKECQPACQLAVSLLLSQGWTLRHVVWDIETRGVGRSDTWFGPSRPTCAGCDAEKNTHLLYRCYMYILLETIPFRWNNRLMSLCRFIAENNAEFRSHNLQRSPRGKLWGGGGHVGSSGGGVTWGALQNVPIAERARYGSFWWVRWLPRSWVKKEK